MQEKLNIAVFVDYDNIEIGLKSTLRRDFDVSLALDALKERGDLMDTLLADYGLYHLEADLRWIDHTAARLDMLAQAVCQ